MPSNKRTWQWVALLLGIACMVGLLFSQQESDSDNAPQTEHDAGQARGTTSDADNGAGYSPQPETAASNDINTASATQSLDTVVAVFADLTSGHEAIASDSGSDTNSIAAQKEALIREKFGLIQRSGRWIPTIGGGTDMVYITTGSLPYAQVGQPFEAWFNAESGNPPYQWTFADTNLPATFSFDGASGYLSGTPTEPCMIVLMLEVSDSHGARDVAEYVLLVQPNAKLQLDNATLPAAYPGQAYSCQLTASGGVPPYEWKATGEVEDFGWLAVDPHTGLLTGQISTNASQGDVELTFLLNDQQLEVSKQLIFHVRSGLSVLDYSPESLLSMEPVEHVFQATGGTEPYRWSHDGLLPTGLTLSDAGVLTGSPTTPGTYNANVWVHDGAGASDALPLTFEVQSSESDGISGFVAFASRNSVALQWRLPETQQTAKVSVIRKTGAAPASPTDGTLLYHGTATAHEDRDVGQGTYYYTIFLDSDEQGIAGLIPSIVVKLPPDADPFADRLVSKHLLHTNAYHSAELPGIVLGAPEGTGMAWGSTNVVSQGAAINNDNGITAPYGGSITLEFTNNLVWNGPNADFTVFENVFYIYDENGIPNAETRFMEVATVAVSQDGISWMTFPTDFSPRFDPETGEMNLRHPYCYNKGFAGVDPVMSNGTEPDPTDTAVSGGDSFDLTDLSLEWIRYIRIQSTGSEWLTDSDGDLIYHIEDSSAATRSFDKSGFDLDAVTAIWMTRLTPSNAVP